MAGHARCAPLLIRAPPSAKCARIQEPKLQAFIYLIRIPSTLYSVLLLSRPAKANRSASFSVDASPEDWRIVLGEGGVSKNVVQRAEVVPQL